MPPGSRTACRCQRAGDGIWLLTDQLYPGDAIRRGNNSKAGTMAKTPGATVGRMWRNRPTWRSARAKVGCRCSRRATNRSSGVRVRDPRRQPARMPGDSLDGVNSHINGPDLACRHPEGPTTRPGADAPKHEQAQPCHLDRHHHLLRSQRLDQIKREQDQSLHQRRP